MKKQGLILMAALAAPWSGAQAATRPVVVELFTSQGCSSCPPADRLLGQLAQQPDILPLSFHVHYWDYLGWKDPFSSEQNTNRQRTYVANFHQRSPFTPQIVVDGVNSAVGSDSEGVAGAIRAAQQDLPAIPIGFSADAGMLRAHIGSGDAADGGHADIYEVRYQRHANTMVTAGENVGNRLASVNNVTQMRRLGGWDNQPADYALALPGEGEGVAVIVQKEGAGRILGAQAYGQ